LLSRKSAGELFKEPAVPYDLMHSSSEAAKTDDQEDLDTDEAMELPINSRQKWGLTHR